LTKAVPIMAALSTSSQVELRRAAADILSDIATFDVIARDWARAHVR
jgi:hypothetical protein